jgi:hypothetical protein
MAIEPRLFTVGSIITLILASAATTSIVYGQIPVPKAQNATTNPTSPSPHGQTTLATTTKQQKQPSTPRTNVHSTLSLTQQPKPSMVKILSPSKGEQVLVGKDLVISGTSAGNTNIASINCQVSVNVNGIKPYQRATATGPNGSDDYSKWNFTLIPKYTSIKPGQNKITAKYSCANSPSSFYNSVNVTGVTTFSGTATKISEINLKVGYAHFISMPTSTNNKERQIKVIVNYTAAPSIPIINKTINAEMKVYAPNGTLIKTSSFRNGFVLKHSGTAQLATTIKDNRIQQLTAVVQFMTYDKLQPLSNSVIVKLFFGQKIGNKA